MKSIGLTILEMIHLLLSTPFRLISNLSRFRNRRADYRRAFPPPVSAHRIRIVESTQFQDMGPAVATLLRWSYFDMREEVLGAALGDDKFRNELLKGIRRQSRLVMSCSRREVQVKEPDGLTVVVEDVCDLGHPNATRCLKEIMLALRPPGSRGDESSELGGVTNLRGRSGLDSVRGHVRKKDPGGIRPVR